MLSLPQVHALLQRTLQDLKTNRSSESNMSHHSPQHNKSHYNQLAGGRNTQMNSHDQLIDSRNSYYKNGGASGYVKRGEGETIATKLIRKQQINSVNASKRNRSMSQLDDQNRSLNKSHTFELTQPAIKQLEQSTKLQKSRRLQSSRNLQHSHHLHHSKSHNLPALPTSRPTCMSLLELAQVQQRLQYMKKRILVRVEKERQMKVRANSVVVGQGEIVSIRQNRRQCEQHQLQSPSRLTANPIPLYIANRLKHQSKLQSHRQGQQRQRQIEMLEQLKQYGKRIQQTKKDIIKMERIEENVVLGLGLG